MSSLPPLAYRALHFLRLCWNAALSLLSGLSGFFGMGWGTAGGAGYGRSVIFDNGVRVRIGKRIAEGGFSYVFEAYGVSGIDDTSSSSLMSPSPRKYALKRINCSDHDIVASCRREAGVHRSLDTDHPNLLALLALKFDGDDVGDSARYTACYMLFPYMPSSLRGEITKRNLLDDVDGGPRRHFTTRQVLRLLGGLLDALAAMHDAGVSHRDVKLENVMLDDGSPYDGGASPGREAVPVLVDYGSAGPLAAPLASRSDALAIVEMAASQTTAPYRPPELYDGGVRGGPDEPDLDYGRVDVWSCGAVLFGLMHGASPFEMEFRRGSGRHSSSGNESCPPVRIVDCTHCSILRSVPDPPPPEMRSRNDAAVGDGSDGWYPPKIYDFVRYMTNHDRSVRPDVRDVDATLDGLYSELFAGERRQKWESRKNHASHAVTHRGDVDSLLAIRDFV